MKKLIAAFLIFVSAFALATEPYGSIQQVNGRTYFRVVNPTPYALYCYVNSTAGHYEFYVGPSTTSRPYIVIGEYYWECE